MAQQSPQSPQSQQPPTEDERTQAAARQADIALVMANTVNGPGRANYQDVTLALWRLSKDADAFAALLAEAAQSVERAFHRVEDRTGTSGIPFTPEEREDVGTLFLASALALYGGTLAGIPTDRLLIIAVLVPEYAERVRQAILGRMWPLIATDATAAKVPRPGQGRGRQG